MGKWEYAERLLDEEVITREEFDNWNNDKEKYYGRMDMTYDYLWDEDDNEIHFVDRLYSDGIEDEITERRREKGELELRFTNFAEVAEWIKKQEEIGEYIPNR